MRHDARRTDTSPADPRVCFILSAGRTGTVFLSQLLQQLSPGSLTLHEPFPARYELVLANLRNGTGLGGGLLRWLFKRARQRRLRGLGRHGSYIELNPLLCPLTDLLPELEIPLHVVHLVREPASWARSIVSFGASKHFRAIIDFVPFAKPYPVPRPDGWAALGELERALWRWRYCNEQILALRSRCDSYIIVRYEDLFSADAAQRQAALRGLFSQLPETLEGDLSIVDTSTRVNSAPRFLATAGISDTALRAICGDLMATFGYG